MSVLRHCKISQITRKDLVLKALTSLGYRPVEKSAIQDYYGRSVDVDIACNGNIGLNQVDKVWEAVADWDYKAGITQKEFTNTLAKQYLTEGIKASYLGCPTRQTEVNGRREITITVF